MWPVPASARVTRTLGSTYHHAAAESFAHGYHLAVGVGAACLLVAAAVAVIGFRRLGSPGAADPQSHVAPVAMRTGR